MPACTCMRTCVYMCMSVFSCSMGIVMSVSLLWLQPYSDALPKILSPNTNLGIMFPTYELWEDTYISKRGGHDHGGETHRDS